MAEWKRSAVIALILGAIIIPSVWAALTASFSDTVWQVPTFKADSYYLGAVNITGGMTNLAYPEQESTYMVWKDGATYYAKNGHTGAVTSNANIATLTTAVFAAMTNGGTLVYAPGTYTVASSITWSTEKKIHIVGYGAVFEPSANSFSLLRINQNVSMTNGGAVIEGLSFKNSGLNTDVIAVEVYDSYGVVLKDLYIEYYTTAILLNNFAYWTESAVIKDTTLYENTNGIRFGLTAGTNSLGQINLNNIFVHVPAGTIGTPTYGIYQPNGLSIYRGRIDNAVFWLGGDYSTGWYCNGDFTDADIDIAIEATAGTPTAMYGVYLDTLATYGPQNSGNTTYSFTYNTWGTKFSERIHGYTPPTTINPMLMTLPAVDLTVSGITASMTVGEDVTYGHALYMKADGKLWKSDANSTATMPVVALATTSISADAEGIVLLQGFIRDDVWAWTIGGTIYASGTAAMMTQTAPITSGDQVQILGYAVSADIIYFNPNSMVLELV